MAYLFELYSYNGDGSDYLDDGSDDMMLIIAIMITVIYDNDDLNTTCRWDPHLLAYLLELYSCILDDNDDLKTTCMWDLHFLACLSLAEARSAVWGDNIWLRFSLKYPKYPQYPYYHLVKYEPYIHK